MPRLVRNPVRIAPCIAQAKTKTPRVFPQPGERWRVFKYCFKRAKTRSRDVQCAAGVVFAIARRRADAQNFIDALTARELALKYAELVFDAAERRHELQFYAVACRCV